MTTTDTKLETVDRPRLAGPGVRMQLGVSGARRAAAVDMPGARPAPRRMQLGINGARRPKLETPTETAIEIKRASVELEVATIAAPIELGTSATMTAAVALGTCPP